MKTEDEGLQSIPIEKLETSKTNPRSEFGKQELEDLAQSLKVHGQLQPIVVRKKPHKGAIRPSGKYEIVAGERRYRAAKLAKLPTIHAVVKDLSDQQVIEVQIIENLQREDIHPMDEAVAFTKLLKFQDAQKIADAIGKTQSYVHKRMKLSSLTKDMKKRYLKGEIKYIHALQFARLSEENQDNIWRILQQNSWNIFEQGYAPYGKMIASDDKLRDEIDSKLFHKLSAAKFNIKDEKLDEKAGPCGVCEHNTGCSPQFFDDVKGDRCTNPKCFNGKVRKSFNNKINAIKEKHPDAKTGTITWEGVRSGGVMYSSHETGKKAPAKKWLPVIVTKVTNYEEAKRGKLIWVNPDASKKVGAESSYEKQQAKEAQERMIQQELEVEILEEVLKSGLEEKPNKKMKLDFIQDSRNRFVGRINMKLLKHFDMITKDQKIKTVEDLDAMEYSERTKLLNGLLDKITGQSLEWVFNVMAILESISSNWTTPKDEDNYLRLIAIEKGIKYDERLKAHKRKRNAEINKEKKAKKKPAEKKEAAK